MNTLNDLSKQIATQLNNPSFTVSKVMEYFIGNQPENFDIAGTSSPFVNLMQAGASFASASFDVHNMNLGRIYSSLATTRKELYMHLNERDFDDVFSQPAKVLFNVYIDVDTIIQFGVHRSNYHKVRLMKGATFKAGDVMYVLPKSYEIRIISKKMSKVFTENDEGNTIISPSDIITARDGRLMVIVPVEADQLLVSLGTYDVSLSGTFRKFLEMPDDFSRCDVFTRMENKWVQLDTTYSTQRFDRYKPIIQLTPLENEVEIYIPPIYTKEKMVSPNLLVLGYSTMPGGHPDFTNTPIGDIRIINKDPIEEEQEIDVEAFSKTTYYASAEKIIEVGRDALSMEELHWRIKHRAYSKENEPITHKQMYASIKNIGYSGILYSNHEARLVQTWLLTSNVIPPKPTAGIKDNTVSNLITPPECGFINIKASLEELSQVFGIRSTDYSVTIPPEILFKLIDGKYVPQSIGYTNSISLLSPHILVDALNKEELYYSPYYYNFYKKDDVLETRIYDFKDPKIISLSTDTLTTNGNYIVLMDRVTIINQEDNFLIEIVTADSPSNETLSEDDFFSQLSWVHNHKRYFILTDDITKVSNTFIIRFRIETEYEILKDEDIIVLTNALQDLSVDYESVPFNINGRFNIIFGSKVVPNGWIDNTIDEYIHRVLVSDVRIPLSLETIHLDLGTNLKYLWNSSRFLPNENKFAVWDHDVPLRYNDASIEVNTNSPVPFILGDNCDITFRDIHKEDEVVRDEEGNIIYIHRKGDIMIDEFGNPILIDIMKKRFDADIFVLNAMANFVTDQQKDYVRELVTDITNKSAVLILPLVERILEHVSLFNYPMNMIGKSRTKPDADYPALIDLPQKLKVKFIVPNNFVNDKALLKRVRRLTIEAIDSQIKGNVVSVKKITDEILKRLPPDIQDVGVENLGGVDTSLRISLISDRDRVSIKKKLMVSTAGYLSMVEDIDISYDT